MDNNIIICKTIVEDDNILLNIILKLFKDNIIYFEDIDIFFKAYHDNRFKDLLFMECYYNDIDKTFVRNDGELIEGKCIVGLDEYRYIDSNIYNKFQYHREGVKVNNDRKSRTVKLVM